MECLEWGFWGFLSTENLRLTNIKRGCMTNEINYDKLMEKALKHVVIEALKIASDEGLPGEHHFYISFKTNHPDVRMSADLLNQYPEDMTIVLQHQFANLMLSENYFEVDLSFSNIPHTLRIPYDSITYFADPHARFALSFAPSEYALNVDEKSLRRNSRSCINRCF